MTHLLPLLGNQFGIDLTELQRLDRSVLSDFHLPGRADVRGHLETAAQNETQVTP